MRLEKSFDLWGFEWHFPGVDRVNALLSVCRSLGGTWTHTGRAEFAQFLMQCRALRVVGDLDHVVGLAVAAAEVVGLFTHLE